MTVTQIRKGAAATRALATAEEKPKTVADTREAVQALLDDLLSALLDLPQDVWLTIPDEIADRIFTYIESAD